VHPGSFRGFHSFYAPAFAKHLEAIMTKPPVRAFKILRVTSATACEEDDLVASEEPLGIELGYSSDAGRETRELAVTMRTPGNDLELVLGFLFTEGVIRGMDEVSSIRHCENVSIPENTGNIVKVELSEGVRLAPHLFQRHSFISSSCGVCGKASIDAVRSHCALPAFGAGLLISASTLLALGNSVFSQQRVFGVTGGLHAAALFDAQGKLLLLREDIGRHNAVDKIVGVSLSEGVLPLERHILFLSGRACFELIQKAALAGIRVVCAVGAPSSLAVECAREFGMTLVGFLRGERFNVYSGAERLSGISTSLPGA
jgi:FdhD protein